MPRMLERNWGRIVFIVSEAGVQPNPEMIHYSVTKTTQIALARGLAEMTKETSVTVNSAMVAPTWTEGVEVFLDKKLRLLLEQPLRQGKLIILRQME
jgi:short-subunit dehydrogenase